MALYVLLLVALAAIISPWNRVANFRTAYVKPWKDVLLKRGLGTILYLVIALGVACLAYPALARGKKQL